MKTDEEFEESKMEISMTIEEIVEEPQDSTRIPRCKKCRRMCFGHEGPTGLENCKLDVIEDDDKLKEEDKRINIIRQKVRQKKRKFSDESKVESETKKKKEEPKDENEKLRDILRRKESDTAKLIKKKEEQESRKLKEMIAAEEEKQSKLVGGGKPKRYSKERSPLRRRSRSTSRRTERKRWTMSPRRRKSITRSPSRRSERKRRREGFRNSDSYRGRYDDRSFLRDDDRNRSRYGDNPHWRDQRPPRGSEFLENLRDPLLYNRRIPEPPTWGKEDTFSAWRRRVELWDEETYKPERKANMLMEAVKKDENHKEVAEVLQQEVIKTQVLNGDTTMWLQTSWP